MNSELCIFSDNTHFDMLWNTLELTQTLERNYEVPKNEVNS